MENYQIELTEAGRENIEETINCLVESAKAIAESSEADFETIKEKKWYKRLWEVITFSKDNQKIQARGVSNLAKLNEITMKAIVILSKYSAETAEIVSESVQKIENLENCFGQLASGMKKIALEVKSLKYNYKKSLSIQDLNVTDRDIVGSIFFKYVKSCLADGIMPNEYSQKFYSYAMEGDTPEDDISVETHLDLLSNDVQQLLYRLNQSYYYLIKGEFDDSDYFDDFDISRKNIKVIKEQIENAVLLMGAENYSNSLLPEDELYYIDESYIDFEEVVMDIEDMFLIRNRGVVILGTLECDEIRAGESINVNGVKCRVLGIELWLCHEITDFAVYGDNVGLLLNVKDCDVFNSGDTVYKI